MARLTAEVEPKHPTGGNDRSKLGRTLIGDSLLISSITAGSRITGLLRVIIAAAVLGSTVLGDLFIAVNMLPLVLYDVLAGSAISSVVVPPVVRRLQAGDTPGAQRLIANTLGFVIVAMGVLAAIAVLARSWIARALTAGVDGTLADDAVSVAVLLLAIILPQLVLYAAIGIFVSVQHAHRRFVLPSAAPIIENVGLIATIIAVGIHYGGGLEVDAAPRGLVLLLAVGSSLSVLAHTVVQLIGAWRAAGGVSVGAGWGDPSVRALAGPAAQSLGWSGIIALRHFALIVAAGFAGAGGVQAFQLAVLVYFVPLALFGRPVASAALPRLAAVAPASDGLLVGYVRALRLAACVAVPAGVAMALLASPLADAIAQGRFSASEATRLLSFALAGLAIGATSEALFEVSRQATMAHRAGAGLHWSSLLRGGTALVGIPLVVVTLDGAALLLGLGLVVSVGDAASLIVTHLRLRSDRTWPDAAETLWPRVVGASVLAILPAAVVAQRFTFGHDIVRFVFIAVAVAILYAGALLALTDRGRMLRALRAPADLEEAT